MGSHSNTQRTGGLPGADDTCGSAGRKDCSSGFERPRSRRATVIQGMSGWAQPGVMAGNPRQRLEIGQCKLPTSTPST